MVNLHPKREHLPTGQPGWHGQNFAFLDRSPARRYDGPEPGPAGEILQILQEKGARATFFVLGDSVEKHPLKSQAFYQDEVERTDAAIRAAGQKGPILFRPPDGKKLLGLPYYLSRTGRKR